MATIHEQVYNSSDVDPVLSIRYYIELTLKNLFRVYGSKINLHLDVNSLSEFLIHFCNNSLT